MLSLRVPEFEKSQDFEGKMKYTDICTKVKRMSQQVILLTSQPALQLLAISAQKIHSSFIISCFNMSLLKPWWKMLQVEEWEPWQHVGNTASDVHNLLSELVPFKDIAIGINNITIVKD